MKVFVAVGFAALLGFSSLGWSAEDGKIRDYPLDQVAEHTWVIHGPLETPSPENQGFMNNPGFVVTADSVVVVDPGSSVQAGRLVVDKIRSVTDKPLVAYPNSGETYKDGVWSGEKAFPPRWGNAMIVGGCCRIAPEQIRALGPRPSALSLDDRSLPVPRERNR